MTLPSIPDNIYKLILLAGIFCLGYGYLEEDSNNNQYFSKVEAFNNSIDSLDIEVLKINHQKEKLQKAADFLSRRNSTKNPITENDSSLTFNRTIVGAKLEMAVSDSLSKLWEGYTENQFKIKLFNNQLRVKKESLSEAKEEFNIGKDTVRWINWTGGICLIIGLVGMLTIQSVQDELLKRQLSDKPKYYKYCQSCGKKFSSMLLPAKNSDGTVNTAFCTECFKNGNFIEPELTDEDFYKRAKNVVKKRKTWLGRILLSTRLRTLERWQKDEYY